MKGKAIYWIIGAAVLLYLYSQQQSAAATAAAANTGALTDESYASTAAGVVEDLF